MLKPVPGYPQHQISDLGELFRGERLLKSYPAIRGGYLQIRLYHEGTAKTLYVHQLVALSFHGERPSARHHAAHRDGNKLNNTPLNVQWITKEQNEADKIAHGRTNRGERNGSAKVTNVQALEMIDRARLLPRSSGGAKLKKGALAGLAAEYGLTPSGAWQIINGYRRVA